MRLVWGSPALPAGDVGDLFGVRPGCAVVLAVLRAGLHFRAGVPLGELAAELRLVRVFVQVGAALPAGGLGADQEYGLVGSQGAQQGRDHADGALRTAGQIEVELISPARAGEAERPGRAQADQGEHNQPFVGRL
ncbi:MAG: hypothetical protein ACK2TW_02410 [Anaerolineales bacterium]